MSEEEAQKDFVGFAEDIQQLRFTIRASLGLSPMRPLERMRMNTQALSERMRSWQQTRQNPECTGQRAGILPRPFGVVDRFLQPMQPQQAEEPLTLEEEERLRQHEEELRRKREKELRKERATRVKNQEDFSPIL
ncbi:hypothetical protein ES702_05330 [subsurface metagenome]